MTSLDQNMASLVERGLVDMEEARGKAKDPGEFARLVALPNRQSLNGHTPTAPNGAPTPRPPGGAPPEEKPKAPPLNPAARGAQFRPGYQK